MKKRKYIFKYNLSIINIISIILLLICTLITYIIYHNNIYTLIYNEYILYEIILIIIWCIIHELIHGIFYFLNGAKWSNIKFGIALENGILYCKSCEKITKRNILISVISPLILIGIITYIIGIIYNLPILIFLSIINICGASGDIVVFIFFIKRNKDLLFKEIGDTTTFYLETKEDLNNKKFLGIKLDKEIEDESILKDNLSKKINISKKSIIILIIILIISLLPLISYLFIK